MVILFTILFVFLFPSNAFCWGPITHIDFAVEVLNLSQYIAPRIAELIMTFPYDYLYGNIGADIVIGKNFTEYEYHCHNWLIGFQVLKSARNNHQKAFAYGYISHLAADVIAHNYFVPNKIITSYRKKLLPHPYWEIRFEKMIDESSANIIGKTFKQRHVDDNDLLKATLEKTLFSFSTNKRLFNGLMFMTRKKFLRGIFHGLTSDKKWGFTKEEFREYKLYSLDAVFDVLINIDKSIYTRFDPTGNELINASIGIRKQLNRLHKRGMLTDPLKQELTKTIIPHLQPGIYSLHEAQIK